MTSVSTYGECFRCRIFVLMLWQSVKIMLSTLLFEYVKNGVVPPCRPLPGTSQICSGFVFSYLSKSKSNFKKLRLKQLSPVKSKLFLKVEKNRTLFSRESRLSWLRRAYCPFPLAKPGLLSFFFVRIRNFKNAVFYRLTILT